MYCHFVGCAAMPFREQRDGEIGTSGTAGVRLAEKDRAKAIGDAEVRIQRRRQIEQRVEQRVGADVFGRRETLLRRNAAARGSSRRRPRRRS